MRGNVTSDFLIFVVALVLFVIILSTAFGKGILYNVMGFFALSKPDYLAKEFTTFTTAVAYMPGDAEMSTVKVDFQRLVEVSTSNIKVTDPSIADAAESFFTLSYPRNPSTTVTPLSDTIKAGKALYISKINNVITFEVK